MVTRRDFMKLAGLGVGALMVPGIAKAKMEDDMTIHIHSTSNSGYITGADNTSWPHDDTTNTAGKFPGMVVGVSIFNSGEVVSSITDENGKEFTYLREDETVGGVIRTEIWYMANFRSSDEASIFITLTGTANFVAGACCYNYFGGIGTHSGNSGTAVPLASATLTPTQLNSILFSLIAIDSPAGAAGTTDSYGRWSVQSGDYSGVGIDRGPVSTITLETMGYQDAGTALWAISAAELLNYQSTPPAIMGF